MRTKLLNCWVKTKEKIKFANKMLRTFFLSRYNWKIKWANQKKEYTIIKLVLVSDLLIFSALSSSVPNSLIFWHCYSNHSASYRCIYERCQKNLYELIKKLWEPNEASQKLISNESEQEKKHWQEKWKDKLVINWPKRETIKISTWEHLIFGDDLTPKAEWDHFYLSVQK